MVNKFREINELVEVIKKEIPSTFENCLSLVEALDDIKYSSAYRPSESYNLAFEQMSEVLYSYLGIPDTDWKKRIAGIFNGTIKTNVKLIEINL